MLHLKGPGLADALDAVFGDVPSLPPELTMPKPTNPGREAHRAAHAQPAPEVVTVERTMRHADGCLCHYRLTFDPAQALRCLAGYARENTNRRAMSGAGGVTVEYLGDQE